MSTDVGDRIAGGDEGQRLGDDLVTPLDASDNHRDMECRSTVDRCHAVFGTTVCSDALLEFGYTGTDGRDEVGVDAFREIFFLVAAENRTMESCILPKHPFNKAQEIQLIRHANHNQSFRTKLTTNLIQTRKLSAHPPIANSL